MGQRPVPPEQRPARRRSVWLTRGTYTPTRGFGVPISQREHRVRGRPPLGTAAMACAPFRSMNHARTAWPAHDARFIGPSLQRSRRMPKARRASDKCSAACDRVQQHTIKTRVLKPNTLAVVLDERVHGGPPDDRCRSTPIVGWPAVPAQVLAKSRISRGGAPCPVQRAANR